MGLCDFFCRIMIFNTFRYLLIYHVYITLEKCTRLIFKFETAILIILCTKILIIHYKNNRILKNEK